MTTYEIGDIVRRKNPNGHSYTVGNTWWAVKATRDNLGFLWVTDPAGESHNSANLEHKPADAPTANDPVNPNHYKRGGIESMDIADAYELDRYDFNTMKYVLRAKFKGVELQDLRKARWYLDRKIANLEADAK
jgi:hypothetical protein